MKDLPIGNQQQPGRNMFVDFDLLGHHILDISDPLARDLTFHRADQPGAQRV